MSELLRKYLQSWLAWAEGGAPHHAPYTRAFGLCANRRRYAQDETERQVLLGELQGMFRRDGLDEAYPFGDAEYDALCRKEEQHLYVPRLTWVRSKLAAFPETA